jgi:hypothetical protein
MAKRTITLIEDDLDGTEGAETYQFGWQGTNYSIDLNEQNAKELREFLDRYIKVAAKETDKLPRSSAPKSDKADYLAKVRAWAKENGHTVSERGRVAKNIQEAYEEATK